MNQDLKNIFCYDLELQAHGASSLRRPVSSTEEWDSYMDHEVKVEAGFER